jgi:hypothetical protein
VYQLLADGSTWPDWSPIDAFAASRARDAEGLQAVGCSPRGATGAERVVECRPEAVFLRPERDAVADYTAVITLTPAGGGTRINWHSTSGPRCPARVALSRELGKFIRQP